LVANPFRHGGAEHAERYFENGFTAVFARVRDGAPPTIPMTVYYAFKQSERDDHGEASTGWETLLEGIVKNGWAVTGTWPVRTEMPNRMRDIKSNALASSVVLACRPRPEDAGAITLRGFLAALKAELPKALKELKQGSIPPVDLAQAAIGPGMAVFSRYATVVESDGSDMTVRTALTLINAVLDEVLTEQEGDFDTDTRFCVRWFRQFGWDEQPYGRADELSRAVNTSVDGLVRGGVFWARAGRARLIELGDLSGEWDPETDERTSVWEVVLRLAKALDESGVDEAARLMAASGGRIDLDAAKELAYLLFSICERRGWTQTALLFNGLGTSWSDVSTVARTGGALAPPPVQDELDYGTGEE
jgi:putative DNA methylase